MTKQIIMDTETTGLEPAAGHRLVSIAAVEIENFVPTGRFIHFYLNPERDSDPRALEVHGLTSEFLADKPKFSEVAWRVLRVLQSAPMVIHNAPFDMKFLRAEVGLAGAQYHQRYLPICTLTAAQFKFGRAKGRNTLDALTARFGAPDLRASTGRHGALIDCLQLVNVYRGIEGLSMLDFPLSPFLGESNESEGHTVGERVPAVAQADAPAVPGDPGQSGPGAGQVV